VRLTTVGSLRVTGTSIVRLFAAIGFAACGADANTSPTVGSTPPVIPVVKGPPGLTVIAEGSHTDTAGATLPNGLTVLVRDAEGLPMKGVGVQLDATTTGNPSAVEPLVFLADNSLFGTASYGAATRADGSLTVRVQFGKKAATVRARISVRSLGLADSVTYSILPASAFRIAVAPSDTLLMIGAHGFASQMFFETVAHNRFDDRADVSGHRPNKDEIRSGEPGSLKGSLWNQLDLIRHLEGPASLSEDAGGYLCNFIYYEALRRFPNHRVGFLHVPTFDKLSEDIQAAAIKDLIAEIRG